MTTHGSACKCKPSERHSTGKCNVFKTFSDASNNMHVFRVFCRKWNCETCRPRLIATWSQHMAGIWEKITQKTLVRVVIHKDAWDGYRQYLRRAGLLYVRIRWNNEEFVVWHTSPDGEYTGPDATKGFDADLKAATGLYREVSSSRRWKLPKPEPKESELTPIKERILPDIAKQQAKRYGIMFVERGERLKLITMHCDPTTRRFLIARCAELSQLVLKQARISPSESASVEKSGCDSSDAPWMGDERLLDPGGMAA